MADPVEASVQRKPTVDSARHGIFMFSQLFDQIVPDWWSERRDAFFRDFWPTEPTLASAIYSISARNAAFGWRLTGLPEDTRWGQHLLQFSDFGAGWQSLITKTTIDLLTCLAGPSTIMLGGNRRGQRKSVRAMVKDRDIGPVLSVEQDGSISERFVTGWHKSPLGNRRWMWLRLNRASFHGGKRPGGLYLTDDHLVNTTSGWKRADALNPGDPIYTGYPTPNGAQTQLIIGTLLGDASMSMKHGASSAMLRFTHCDAQSEWLDTKVSALRGFGWTPKTRSSKSDTTSLNSHCTPGLEQLFNEFYSDNKKHIPLNLVREAFSPIMLAAWYLDDGTMNVSKNRNGDTCRPGLNLCTHSFDREEVEELISIFAKHGFEAKVYDHKSTNGKIYPVLYLGADSAELFYKTIAKYVPESMRYKLPIGVYDLEEYNPELWNLGSANAFIDTVETIVYKDYTSGYKTLESAYCLDVEETHNFSVCGVNVHNCDNGSFWEIIRPSKVRIDGLVLPAVKQIFEPTGEAEWFALHPSGRKTRLTNLDVKVYDSPLDLPIGIAHLDSGRVQRTGDPDIPAIYTDIDGKSHPLRWWQLISFADMPSPIEDMNGVGVCALSRVFRYAHTLQSVSIYQDEKVSGRFTRKIYLTNADPALLEDQIRQASDNADNAGLMRYSQPVVASTFDPSATPSVAEIELASIPDSFNYNETMEWYISILALALGVDYGFLAPLPGKGLGTASQSETMQRQSRGKSSRLFMDMISDALNFRGVLPESVRFEFIERDAEQEKVNEANAQIRAQTRQLMIKSGEITPQIARQLAADAGDLPVKYLEALGEQDLTPGISIEGGSPQEAQERVAEAPAPTSLIPNLPIENASDEVTEPEAPMPSEPNGVQTTLASYPKGYSIDEKAVSRYTSKLFPTISLATTLKNAARKALRKETPSSTRLENALATYESDILTLVEAGRDGRYDESELSDLLTDLVLTALLSFFSNELGASYKPYLSEIEDILSQNEKSAASFSSDIIDGRYAGRDALLRNRVGLYIADALTMSMLGTLLNRNHKGNHYKFIMGPTSDHCIDCIQLDGQVHTAEDWYSHRDRLPRSHSLACKGYNCKCMLEPTNEPETGSY